MECCNKDMLEVTQPNPDHIHLCCSVCGSHYHVDRLYTADEWFFLINEEKHLAEELR